MKKIALTTLVLTFTPFVTFAAECVAKETKMDTLAHIANWASCTLISYIIPLLFTLAVAGFIWGIVQYYLNPDNEEKRKKGKSYMIWGIIALFVMDELTYQECFGGVSPRERKL